MFKNLINRIKAFGVGKAINALDLLEGQLESKLEEFKKETSKMDSHQMAVFLIDQVQDALRQHFKLK